ncbi:hypothetical protein T11_428 [Trichinella zimbabwensis]|uniref:Uncharacterized protein n=1 Tax=Trichinella zimbabwensis TaxID=268475 RepID=A0A0V1H3N7_9BILA|nr:hypothetical protein T11_428 [Trichinella zimbabwensis]
MQCSTISYYFGVILHFRQQLRIREQTTQGRNAKADRLNCPHIKKLGNKYKSIRDQLAKNCKQYHQYDLLHYDNLSFYLNFTNA